MMREIKKCRRCDFRKLLVIDEFKQINDGSPTDLDVWAGFSPALRAGKFRAIVCCRCGYTEWYAHDMAIIMDRLGELYPGVRVVDGELTEAVQSLTLRFDTAAPSG